MKPPARLVPPITITADLTTGDTLIDTTSNLPDHLTVHQAFMDWLRAIGLDPSNLPADTTLRIDNDRGTISGTRFWRDDDDRRRAEPGTTSWRREPFTHQMPDPVPPLAQVVMDLAAATDACPRCHRPWFDQAPTTITAEEPRR